MVAMTNSRWRKRTRWSPFSLVIKQTSKQNREDALLAGPDPATDPADGVQLLAHMAGDVVHTYEVMFRLGSGREASDMLCLPALVSLLFSSSTQVFHISPQARFFGTTPRLLMARAGLNSGVRRSSKERSAYRRCLAN